MGLQHPLGGLRLPQPDGGIGVVAVHIIAQVQRRGEPPHQLPRPAHLPAVIAVVEGLHGRLDQDLHPVDQHVEHCVEGGQGQNVPGEHGAEHRHGVEQQAFPAAHPQPEPQPLPGHYAAGQLHQQGEQGDDDVGHDGEAQPRQVVGEKQPLPAYGQGAEEIGRPRVVEVAERRHGAHRPEACRQHQHPRHTPRHVRKGEVLHVGASVLALQAQVHHPTQGQGQQPDHQIRRPQRPEAQHRLFENRPVKVRCPGPHSPHLPFHR